MAGGGGGGDGDPEFQVAPLIDVLLVMLIFFMTITTSQTLKIDRSIELPVTPAGKKTEDKGTAGLINIGWDKTRNIATYKLDDIEISDIDAEEPVLKGGKSLIAELKSRMAFCNKNPETKGKFKLLIRADKKVQAKFINKALQWGANAEIDNIAFSGTNQ